MKIGIIHLSDIHFKENRVDNPCIERSKYIVDSIKGKLLDIDCVVFTITGDIAFSGKKAEFDFGIELVKQLEYDVKSALNKSVLTITIPGNHDCLFHPDSVRNMIIDQLESSNYTTIDNQIVELCCKPQENYFAFEKELSKDGWQTLFQDKLLQVLEFKKGEENVVFFGFNSSWISKINEKYGTMAYPIQKFENPVFETKSNLTINLIHHPINWQAQGHYRELRRELESCGDLIMSGHEHVDEFSRRSEGLNNPSFTGYIEAGAFQDSAVASNSKFNLVLVDVTKIMYQIIKYDYDDSKKIFTISDETEMIPYDQRYNLSKKEYPISKPFKKFLDDVGAPFRHPKYENIHFDDLYVQPDLMELSIDPINSAKPKRIIGCEELNPSQEEFKYLIIGSESSGKTSICKNFFNVCYENNLVPILIDASEIKDVNKTKFHEFLKTVFSRQYDKRCHGKFEKIAFSQFVIIIDNFNSLKIPPKYRQVLITNIKEVYKKFYITGDSLVHFQPFTITGGTKIGVFDNFLCFGLMEFGVENRYKLINKWNRLGLEFDDESEEVYRLNDYAEQHIKTILGNHYIPCYPIYIITLLQSIASSSGNSNYNLYGYYYEYLINEAINKTVINKDYHQFYHQLLSEYCYFLFENKVKNISKDNFKKVFLDFQLKYQTSLDFENVLTHLLSSKLLELKDGFLYISHSYIYYYYVAKNISNNLSNGFFRDLVKKMVLRVYNEEFASIIIFLSHISKDPLITDELYQNALRLFSNIPETKLESDIELINNLIDELPRITYENKDIEQSRLIDLRVKEESERIEKEYETAAVYESDLDEDINAIDILNSIVLAVKTFEILGQITKKYWGSTTGEDKIKFTSATYNLALRTLNYYYKLIGESKEYITECLRVIVDRKKIMDVEKVKHETQKLLFQYSYLSTSGITKRIVDSTGHRQLSDTYAELISRNPTNAYKLIDIAIKLEHYGSFPIQEIRKLKEDPSFAKNFLCEYIIKNLVLQYLYLYPTQIETKQRICDLVGIDIKQQLVIDQTSKEKRK